MGICPGCGELAMGSGGGRGGLCFPLICTVFSDLAWSGWLFRACHHHVKGKAAGS